MGAISEDYVDQARQVIEGLAEKESEGRRARWRFSTTQLRVLLSLTAQLYEDAEGATGPTLSQDLRDKVQYLRVRFVYQAGREPGVRRFIEEAKLLSALKEIGDSRVQLIKFCRYMEALVAYKKYLDTGDK